MPFPSVTRLGAPGVRSLAGAALVLLPPGAQGAEYFSRADCVHDGDGSAYTCASAPGGPGAWHDLKVRPSEQGMGAGDTWYLCGTFPRSKAKNATLFVEADVGGAPGVPMTYTGNCEAFGGDRRAVLDGERTGYAAVTADGIRHGINLVRRSPWATVEYLDVRNVFGVPNEGNGITFPSAGGTGPEGIVIRHNRISNVGLEGIVTGGPGLVLTDNEIVRTGNDGIYVAHGSAGGSATGNASGLVARNFVADVSRNGLGGGDGIKFANCTNVTGETACRFEIRDNVVFKTGRNKAGINVHGAGNGVVLVGNRIVGRSWVTGDETGTVVPEAFGSGIGSGTCTSASVACLAELSSGLLVDGCGVEQGTGRRDGLPVLRIEDNTVEDFGEHGITLAPVLNTGVSSGCSLFVTGNRVVDVAEQALNVAFPFPDRAVAVLDNELGHRGDVTVGIALVAGRPFGTTTLRGNRVSARGHNVVLGSGVGIDPGSFNGNRYDAGGTWRFRRGTEVFAFRAWQELLGQDPDGAIVPIPGAGDPIVPGSPFVVRLALLVQALRREGAAAEDPAPAPESR